MGTDHPAAGHKEIKVGNPFLQKAKLSVSPLSFGAAAPQDPIPSLKGLFIHKFPPLESGSLSLPGPSSQLA